MPDPTTSDPTISDPTTSDRQNLKALRSQLRRQRRSLSITDQAIAGQQIASQLRKQWFFKLASKIGIYWPHDAEPDLLKLAGINNKSWYLPVISDQIRRWENLRLLFQQFNNTKLVNNKFGIVEPGYQPKQLINPNMLDLILVPLVGFDRSGNRLGMGKGYYDRTFAKHQNAWHKPLLVGIAHSIQETSKLSPQAWDVALDIIVTEKEIFRCKMPTLASQHLALTNHRTGGT
ncbi:MAG: 5-formyltetrahydrofolate cyclo-ligase [Pseudomonadales bacterium]|nr:5-formyltetrahydrofolate cyclo-ligase [Pseudomonadales bacterium]